MVVYKEQMVQRPLNYAIIDEVDSILIDASFLQYYRSVRQYHPKSERGMDKVLTHALRLHEKQQMLLVTNHLKFRLVQDAYEIPEFWPFYRRNDGRYGLIETNE